MKKSLTNLTVNEMLAINGGHDGAAYDAGRAFAKVFKIGIGILSFALSRGRTR